MKTRNAALTMCLLAGVGPAHAADDTLPEARLAPVRKYIKDGWTTLTRGPRDIVRAAPDPKLHLPPGTPWPVYVSAREDRARVERELTAQLSPAGAEADRAARAAERPAVGDGARPALPAAPVRGAGRPLQRDVRLGQLLHPGRPAARRRDRQGARAGRELPLRDRPLRHDPEREPHLLPDALAAALPDAHAARASTRRRATASGSRPPGPRSRSTTRSGRPSRISSRRPACRATTTSATRRGRRW